MSNLSCASIASKCRLSNIQSKCHHPMAPWYNVGWVRLIPFHRFPFVFNTDKFANKKNHYEFYWMIKVMDEYLCRGKYSSKMKLVQTFCIFIQNKWISVQWARWIRCVTDSGDSELSLNTACYTIKNVFRSATIAIRTIEILPNPLSFFTWAAVIVRKVGDSYTTHFSIRSTIFFSFA